MQSGIVHLNFDFTFQFNHKKTVAQRVGMLMESSNIWSLALTETLLFPFLTALVLVDGRNKVVRVHCPHFFFVPSMLLIA